ncbi:MAG TPA: hypothetical protein VK986_15710, partial [Tepidisphaeraceae bacterium]|nr:hypothetical protein [Tepidisphaeraceae bacterium]
DNRLAERAMLDDARMAGSTELLPHEIAHAWNGKHRRPAGMTVPDYQKPLHTELVWVYEGLTSYLGYVLSARSGLISPDVARDRLASTAALMDASPARAWRSLHDTCVAAPVLFGAPHQWRAWRRGTDFYPEGLLLWLEVDSLIRTQTKHAKSLDDFLIAFYGASPGRPTVKPFTLDDLCAALNAVAPHDWLAHFRARLDSTNPRAPLAGLAASGLRVVFKEKPTDDAKAAMTTGRNAGGLSLRYSLGLDANKDAVVTDVLPNSPADRAGLAPGMKLIALNDRRYSHDLLKNTLDTPSTEKRTLTLQVDSNAHLKTLSLDYQGGPRHPHLERDPAHPGPDLLADILKPKTHTPPAPVRDQK